GQERFLRRIARIFFPTQHPKGQREDAPLPPTHYLPERLRVAGQGAFYHLFIAGGRLHSVRARVRPRGRIQMFARNNSRGQSFRRGFGLSSRQKFNSTISAFKYLPKLVDRCPTNKLV